MDANSRLRHLDASRVETPLGTLDHMPVVTGNDRPLGTLEGIIVDPVARHLRYYVVESRDWFTTHRYLVPDTPCRMVPSRGVLQVELDADRLSSLPELRDDEFPPLSTDELGAAGRSRF